MKAQMSEESTPDRALPLQRYESLDIWRGAACLMVVIMHSVHSGDADFRDAPIWAKAIVAVTDRMWVGVPMFFVISGYCIAATADSSRRKGKSVGNYFYRRFRRIYPPYWALLALASIVMLVTIDSYVWNIVDDRRTNSPVDLGLAHWLGNVTLTETWLPNFHDRSAKFICGDAWTLCFEEQFYALTGLVLLLAPKRFFEAFILLTVVTVAGFAVLPKIGLSVRGTFLNGQWIAFAAGIWLYYVRNYRNVKWANMPFWVAVAALAFILRHPERLWENGQYDYTLESFLFSAVVFAGFLVLTSRFDTSIASAPLLRPIAWCGTMCYSLYLIQMLVVTVIVRASDYWAGPSVLSRLFFTVPAGLFGSLIAAHIFHERIEQRFMNPPQKVGTVDHRPASAMT